MVSLEEIKRLSLSGEQFKTIFNMHRIEKTQKFHCSLDNYDAKKYFAKRSKLRDDLSIGEKLYILAERIKKKSAPGKFYKQSVENISFFK